MKPNAKILKPSKPSAPALEWLCDLSGKTPRITSIGSGTLLVENYSGIREFSCEQIVLSTRCGCIVVSGSGLELREVRRDSLIIRGNIRDVKLPRAEADSDEP